MRLRKFDSADDMGDFIAANILKALKKKGTFNLCVPTGNSPMGIYRALARAYGQEPERFNGLKIIKLDEWVGLPKDHPASCEYYIQQQLLGPLEIPTDRYIGFDPNTENPVLECIRMESRLKKEAPFDLCLLGLGVNGHVGLIEPTDLLNPYCQVSELTKQTRAHPMLYGLRKKPRLGMTLGMRQILASKKIILLFSGKGKRTAYHALLNCRVSTQVPVSFLWLHQKVECIHFPQDGQD